MILIGQLPPTTVIVILISADRSQLPPSFGSDSFKELGFFLQYPSFRTGIVSSPSFLLFGCLVGGGGCVGWVVGIDEFSIGVNVGGTIGC